jgi:hypothetical protein
MKTVRYLEQDTFDLILQESNNHYMILDEDSDEVLVRKTSNDVIETRTYLAEGTYVIYNVENSICFIDTVDINDYDAPYLLDLGYELRWCEYEDITEINY